MLHVDPPEKFCEHPEDPGIFIGGLGTMLGGWGHGDEGPQIKEFCLCGKEIYNPVDDEGGNANVKK